MAIDAAIQLEIEPAFALRWPHDERVSIELDVAEGRCRLPLSQAILGCRTIATCTRAFAEPLKLHPVVDSLFAAILAADPMGLILLAARKGHAVELLRQRFAPRIPADTERLLFMPWQTIEDYYRLLQLADVVLDPPHYGVGSSCYDLFSFNLPVVKMPSELIVGRITWACYRKMV